MNLPRIMLAAPASGSGKTLITCGILQALKNRGIKPASFKCGPDYIDPMFHGKVLGISSKNLDTYFTDEKMTRYLFGREAKDAEISVLEGVMGYYDGLAGSSTKASAYDVASVTDTPVILVVPARGMSVSVIPLIQGFLNYRNDSRIRGVILNQVSAGMYPRMKEQIEAELPIKVLGYVPAVSEYVIESRHLGLVTPDEITDIQDKILGLSKVLEDTLDIDSLLQIGRDASEFSYEEPKLPTFTEKKVRMGVAKDEAFCFIYRDNLELLERMGAELCYFSPIHDKELPKDLSALIFYGGYPELYAKKLSDNHGMILEIQSAIHGGMPYLAECGGFMYLHEYMEDMDGNVYPMVGVISGKAYRTNRLTRFGYVELESKKSTILGAQGLSCRGHEFHYFDSSNNGGDFMAKKPLSNRSWDCIHGDERSIAGFPHLYYYSNPEMIARFINRL